MYANIHTGESKICQIVVEFTILDGLFFADEQVRAYGSKWQGHHVNYHNSQEPLYIALIGHTVA